MKRFKLYEEFLNESTWYPTFKAQGEFINKKDHVTIEELEKIAYYLDTFYKMENIQIGKIKTVPNTSSYTKGETVEKYSVSGIRICMPSNEEFVYYWKESSDPELTDLESGWVGKLVMKGKSPGQFMSPFQFLECVEKHYLFDYAWGSGSNREIVSDNHLKEMNQVMHSLALKSPRRGKIIGNKYGLS